MIILSTLKVVSSITVFLLLVLTLITILLFVKSKLSPAGKIKIMINGEKEIEVDGCKSILRVVPDWLSQRTVLRVSEHGEIEVLSYQNGSLRNLN